MKTIKFQKALILVSLAAGVFAAGCELAVDFDRTRIPVESVDSSLLDANALPTGDAQTDANQPSDEAGLTEAGSDDGGDGGSDAADANDADG